MSPKLLLAAALILSSGCSLVLVDGPPDFIPADQPLPEGACTIDRTIPFLDAVGAAASAVVAVTSSEGDYVRVGAVLGAALGYSSYSGFSKVKRCRQRMLLPAGAAADTMSARRFPGPAPFFPGPVPPPGGAPVGPSR